MDRYRHNAAEQGCRDSAWTRDEMAGNYCMRFIELIVAALLLLLKISPESPPHT